MKYVFTISFLLLFFFVDASHLLGSEITYKHRSNNTYDVFVTLYRDCDDCKLGGQGGGSSTANCSDLEELYIRTVNGSCGVGNVGSITLTRLGYEDITPICSSTASKCNDNASYGHGFEAHKYHGTVNFDYFQQYSGCDLHLFFSKSERSGSITTFGSEEDYLFNYALINPWNGPISSPQFTRNPRIVYDHNKSVYSNDGVVANTSDSLSFKWGSALKDHNTAIAYKAGYSKTQFLTPYCPSGNCTPNIASRPYKGIYLDQNTGNFAFTPTNNNEITTRVLEVEQWRVINGNATLVSKVRRDVIQYIESNSYNNHPEIHATNTLFACVGQPFSTTITASDVKTVIGGVTQASDTVRLTVSSKLTSLNITDQATAAAPYFQTILAFTPQSTDVGKHIIQVEARDNHCPEYGTSAKTIELIVLPAPTLQVSITDLFCGYNEIELQSSREGSFITTVLDENDQAVLYDTLESGYIFNHSAPEELTYLVQFTDQFGCEASSNQIKYNYGSSAVTNARLTSDLEYCDNDTMVVALEHNLEIRNTTWTLSNGTSIVGDTLTSTPIAGAISATYEIFDGRFTCNKTLDSLVVVNSSPIVSINIPESICYRKTYNLSSIQVSPNGGNWSSDLPVANSLLYLEQLTEYNTKLGLNYTYVDNVTGCATTQSDSLLILEAPEMELSNEAVCGYNAIYKLANTIELPFHHNVENITWSILNQPMALLENPYMAIDLPTYGAGDYIVEATNTYTNGCVAKDTATITVDDGLTLTTNGKNTLCEGDAAVNLSKYLNINAEGGLWSSLSGADLLNGNTFDPKTCGTYDLNYTYDKYGCFDQMDLTLRVVCKPTFNSLAFDSICSDYGVITLSENSKWSGNGVIQSLESAAVFNPSNLSGITLLTEDQTKEGCVFDTVHTAFILPPITFSYDALEDHYCEGETVEVNYTLNHGLLSVSSCSNNTIDPNTIRYTPGVCDLVKQQIDLGVNITSSALCRDKSVAISVPYYARPTVQIPEPKQACWPYVLETTLTPSSGNLASIQYNIIGRDQNYEGYGQQLTYAFPSDGSYDLKIKTTDNYGCSGTQWLTGLYEIYPKPKASFLLNEENIITLSEREISPINTSYISYGDFNSTWWYEKNSSIDVFSHNLNPVYELPADTGVFKIGMEARSNYGCVDTAHHSVLIVPDVVAFIPNAFTPNHMGPSENQNFTIVSNNVSQFHITIYNKWGQMVFESFNIDNSWDGTYMGGACQMGIYVYTIQLTNKKGVEYRFQGTVNLIR